MRLHVFTLGALAVAAVAAPAAAQERAERVRVLARAAAGDEDRPVIGVSTSSSGERDTLGLLVVSVVPGGPADQAGIEEGNRIATVNGTNLRLAPVDAGERDMHGMTTRRLVREIQKVEPGAEVQLRVWQNGQYRDVRVKTVRAGDLPGRERVSREDFESRGVLGMRVGGSGSRRDTLGVLVIGLTTDGPAEKAGLVEGDRIAAIGDVDLRVPAADAGDDWMSRTRVNRLLRELRDVKPGETVTLRVRSGNQTRTVNVTAVAAKELADEDGSMFIFGENFDFHVPTPAIAPMPPAPPMRIRAPEVRVMPGWPGVQIIDLDEPGFGVQIAPEAWAAFGDDAWTSLGEEAAAAAAAAVEANEALTEARLEELREQLMRATEELDARERVIREREERLRDARREPVRSAAWSSSFSTGDDGEWTAAVPAVAPATAAPEPARAGNTLSLPGLTLSLMNRELASYFGDGAERGLLVLAADARWDGLREGDVIVAVDGRASSGFSCATSLVKGERSVTVLRGGERVAMRVDGTR